MILSVFSKNGRFKELNKQLNKLKNKKSLLILILFLVYLLIIFTLQPGKKTASIDTLIVLKNHSEEVASSRFKTMQDELFLFKHYAINY